MPAAAVALDDDGGPEMVAPPGVRPGSDVVDRVVAAAESCFDRFGLDNTTMERVAKVSGLSRGVIYKYFGNRNGVVLAVLERRGKLFNERARRFLAAEPGLEASLVDGILFAVRMSHGDPYFGILAGAAVFDPQRRIPGTVDLARRLTDELWRPVLAAGQAEGTLAPEIPIEDLVDWITYLQLTLIAGREAGGATEAQQERYLRTMFVPAVVRGISIQSTKESA